MTTHIVVGSRVDLNVTDNADWLLQLRFVDDDGVAYDMSSDSFKMDVKTDVEEATPSLELTSGGGEIDDTDADDGLLIVTIEKAALAAGSYVYDLIRVTGSAEEYLCGGFLAVNKGVTA